MSDYNNGGTFSKLIKWLVVGFLAIIALRVGLFILGAAVKVSLALVFTLGPLVLIGWLVMKMLRSFSRPRYDGPVHDI